MNKTAQNAFTLIELLVVISLIGILATLLVANLNSARERGRDTQRKSDLKNIQTALRLYYNDRGRYPANDGEGTIVGCSSYTSPISCNWGEEWSVGTTVYMPKLPADPLTGQSYKYEYNSTTDTTTLSACLENKSDDKGATTTLTDWCTSAWQYQIKL